MIAFLARLFIADRTEYTDSRVRKKYGTLTGFVGILLNLLLFAGKFAAGALSGAISVTADAFNNLSDAGSSVISLAGFYAADKRPDSDHPFGHGRMEYISGLIVSLLIILMGFELGRSSVAKILRPENVNESALTVAVLAAAILIKLYMFAYNRVYGGRIKSAAMRATAVDSVSDAAATSVVLASVLVHRFAGINIDGYAGAAVSAFIIFAGIKSIKETTDPLLGRAPDKEYVGRIREIVLSYEEITGVHDILVHDYGPGRCMVTLHGEVSEEGNIKELHDAIDRCERELREKLGCFATIHMDPTPANDEELNRLRRELKRRIAEYDGNIKIHDFRLVGLKDGGQGIEFDAVVPMNCKKSDAEIKESLERIVGGLPENYRSMIDIDRE
ncbi:MAG: cation diffusion facilitator family transporter [Bacteroidales bacterium]|nr:cation diffusion facilitator family transporter [Bacteroidales bacterium]